MVKDSGDTSVAEAVDAVYKLSKEDKLKYQSVFEHMYEMDEAAKENRIKLEATEQGLKEGRKKGLEQGREEGLQLGRKEGIEQGVAQSKKEIKQKLKSMNFSDEQIAEILNT